MTRDDFVAKNLGMPEQFEELPKRREEAVTLGRGTLEPGWRWSEQVKPLVGTEGCQPRHIHYVVSGDTFSIPPATTAGSWATNPSSCSTSPIW